MRLGGFAHNFWGLIGSVVAAVLPTTRDILEPTVRLYGATRRNCQGVNAVSWQNLVPRAGVRYGDDSGVDEDDVIHIAWIDFRNNDRVFGIKKRRPPRGVPVIRLDQDAFTKMHLLRARMTG